MTTFAHRTAALTAAALIGLTVTLAGSGVALADPYDDDDGTVQVQPDYGVDEPDYGPDPAVAGEPPPQEVPEANQPAPQPDPPADEGTDPTDPGTDQADSAGGEGDEPDLGGTDSGGPATAGSDSDGGAGDESATDGQPDVSDADVSDADSANVNTAQTATAAAGTAALASATTIDTMRTTIESQYLSSSSSTITQWNSAWVQYDQYYQPVLVNPYRTAVQFAYSYDGNPYVVQVQPLGRTVVNVPRPGVYAFTALVPNSSGGVSNVSVGSFSGGGYVPRAGQPPPPKPAVPNTYRNVVVRFDFGDRKFQPVTIKWVTDLGVDPQVGASKVLLDEETPAWGAWDTTTSGQRELTVRLTERLPGLTEPVAEPPPGYTLVAAQQNPPAKSGVWLLGWVGLGLGVLAVVAVVLVVFIGRRRRTST